MAEVVGLIASVIALCQTVDYIRQGTRFGALLKGAPDEFFHLHNELTAVSSYLYRVKDELDSLRAGAAGSPAPNLDAIRRVVRNLEDDMKELKKLASDIEADARGKVDTQGRLEIPKFKWVRCRSAVQRLRERISWKKADLHHALSVLQMNQTTRMASLVIDLVQLSTDNFDKIARSTQGTDTAMDTLRSELTNLADAVRVSRSANDTTGGLLLQRTQEMNQTVANIEGTVSKLIVQDATVSSEAMSLLRSMETDIDIVAQSRDNCQNKPDPNIVRIQKNIEKLSSLLRTRGTPRENLENRLERLVLDPDCGTVPNRHNIHAGDNTLITVHTTLSSRRCNASCTCQCHKSSMTGTPELLSSLVGKLLLSYNGIPGWRPRTCNHPMCLRRSPSQVHLSYIFPRWMLRRGLSVSLSWSSIAGSGASLHLTIPRIIPDDHPVWDAIASDNKAWLQNKLATKEVVQTDIDCVGESLLMWSISQRSYHCSSLILAEYPITSIAWQDRYGTSFATVVQDSQMTHSTVSGFPALCRALDSVADALYSTPIIDAVRGINGVSLDKALELYPECVNDRDVTGQTALHWAAYMSNIDAVRKLLYYKADVSARDLLGWTPLQLAAKHYEGSPMVRILLEEGSDPNARDAYGQTPLHEAVRWAARENALALLEAGAKADASTTDGKTWFFKAASKEDAFVPNMEEELLSIFEALVKEGGDVNRRDNHGDTPLAVAIRHSNVPVFRALGRLGVKLDYQTSAGQTILHEAAWWAKAQILRELIDLGLSNVDPDHVDESRRTATELFKVRSGKSLVDLDPGQSPTTDEEVELFEALITKVRQRFHGIDILNSGETETAVDPDAGSEDSGEEQWLDVEEFLV